MPRSHAFNFSLRQLLLKKNKPYFLANLLLVPTLLLYPYSHSFRVSGRSKLWVSFVCYILLFSPLTSPPFHWCAILLDSSKLWQSHWPCLTFYWVWVMERWGSWSTSLTASLNQPNQSLMPAFIRFHIILSWPFLPNFSFSLLYLESILGVSLHRFCNPWVSKDENCSKSCIQVYYSPAVQTSYKCCIYWITLTHPPFYCMDDH